MKGSGLPHLLTGWKKQNGTEPRVSTGQVSPDIWKPKPCATADAAAMSEPVSRLPNPSRAPYPATSSVASNLPSMYGHVASSVLRQKGAGHICGIQLQLGHRALSKVKCASGVLYTVPSWSKMVELDTHLVPAQRDVLLHATTSGVTLGADVVLSGADLLAAVGMAVGKAVAALLRDVTIESVPDDGPCPIGTSACGCDVDSEGAFVSATVQRQSRSMLVSRGRGGLSLLFWHRQHAFGIAVCACRAVLGSTLQNRRIDASHSSHTTKMTQLH